MTYLGYSRTTFCGVLWLYGIPRFINNICFHPCLRQGVIKPTCEALAAQDVGRIPLSPPAPAHTHTQWLVHWRVVWGSIAFDGAAVLGANAVSPGSSLCGTVLPMAAVVSLTATQPRALPNTHIPSSGLSVGWTTWAYVCKKLWVDISDRRKKKSF